MVIRSGCTEEKQSCPKAERGSKRRAVFFLSFFNFLLRYFKECEETHGEMLP